MPKNHYSSFTEFGDGIFVMASVFTWSNFIPLDDILNNQETRWTLPQTDIFIKIKRFVDFSTSLSYAGQ